MFSVSNLTNLLLLINTLLDMKQIKMDSPQIFIIMTHLETSEASEKCSNELDRSYLPLDHVFSIKFGLFVAPEQNLTGHEAEWDGFATDFRIFGPLRGLRGF